MKKEQEPITRFIWCGAVVKVYVQVVKFAGTTIQRHLLPNYLRNAMNSAVQDAENIPHSDPTNNKPPRSVRNARPSTMSLRLLQGEGRYASTGKVDMRIRVPAMKGSQLKALLDYIRALK
ncbi:hypothetical protein ACXX29_021740 [Enterobacter mori]